MTRPPTSHSREHKGPFGTPDGSRADLEDILHDFVALDGRPGFGGVATRADDAMVRVIVGRIGAGKTVYMRRLFSFQEASKSVYADPPPTGLAPDRPGDTGMSVVPERAPHREVDATLAPCDSAQPHNASAHSS
jgi:hypothetical protein